jgi:hypothetical protein
MVGHDEPSTSIVIIDHLDLGRTEISPTKADPKQIIDPDRMLPASIGNETV